MGITGITNEMVKGKPTFEKVIPDYKVHPDTKYVVCHNMSFDSQFFPKDFIPENLKLLCTLKLARKLIPKIECENHKNSTLYYYLGCYNNPQGKAFIEKSHDALSDVLMTANVLTSLLEKFNITIDEAYDIVNDVTVCRMNKYAGEKWSEIVSKDYSYCEYVVNNLEWENEDELNYVKTLLKENESIKQEQLKICNFNKHRGKLWCAVIKEDKDYVDWLISSGKITYDLTEYLKDLL